MKLAPGERPGDDSSASGGTQSTDETGGAPGSATGGCGEAIVEAARAGCVEMAPEMCAYFYRCLSAAELAEIEANVGATDAATCAAAVSSLRCTPDAVYDPVRACRQAFYQEDIAMDPPCENSVEVAVCDVRQCVEEL